jgi:hypothetical protein
VFTYFPRQGKTGRAMSKYQPIASHLSASGADEARLSFEAIEEILGAPLPQAALTHRSWWSNNPTNNVMTRAWLGAGYRTEQVDLEGRTLVFRRAALAHAPRRAARPAVGESAGPPRPLLHRLWDALAGTVQEPRGVDLTDPIGDPWDGPA